MADLDDLPSLVHAISALAEQERYFFGLEEIKPDFGGPAPEANLEQMARLFRGRLPKDYLGLLARIDGVQNYDAPDMSLLSSGLLLSEPGLADLFEEVELFEEGEIFIFAQCDTDPHCIAFRIDPESDNFSVIEFDTASKYGEWPDLTTFFEARKAELEERVARQKADRDGLAND